VRAAIELDLAFVGLSSTLDHRPALIHADAAVEYAERGAQRGLLAAALALGAIVEAFAGDAEHCRGRMAAAVAATGGHENCLVLEWSAIAVALLDGALGDMEAVDAGTETVAAFFGQFELVDPVHLAWLPEKIEALVVLGDLVRAKRLTELLGNSGRHFGRPPTIAAAERSRAVMLAAEGDLDGAHAALASALDHLALAPLPLELARTLLLLGQVQRRRKQKAAAREALERSAAIYDGVGATLWAERARGELTRLGVRREADELTASEARVAELAASGLTNREIATAAFMSQKTVEANLSRVYRKLGIRARAQLALKLAEQPDRVDSGLASPRR
jgi:DNA-binding NarL/FixJ family response regulator